jgi:hypothetical protein
MLEGGFWQASDSLVALIALDVLQPLAESQSQSLVYVSGTLYFFVSKSPGNARSDIV